MFMRFIKITALFGFAISLFTVAQAQWPQYHGNAQRTGRTAAIGPTTPTLKWAFDLKGPMLSSPVVGADGTVYTGSVWQESLTPSSWIYAISSDGTLKWRFRTPWRDYATASSPALGPQGQVFVGAADGSFFAIDSNGQQLWVHHAAKPVESHPVVFGDRVYVTLDAKLTAFNLTGQIQWQYDLGINYRGGPAVATDGTIYAFTSNSTVALNPDGSVKWTNSLYTGSSVTPVVSPNGDVIVAGDSLVALSPIDGALKWIYYRGWSLASFGAPAVDPQGNVYYSAYVYVWKLSPSGSVIWEKMLEGANGFLGSTFTSLAIDGAGKLYAGMGTGKRWAIPMEKFAYVWNSTSGAQLGSFPVPEITSLSSPAIAPNGTIYIGCLDGKLYALQE
jgi:hypothetical protein